jgi:SAM-dependent methyltransferase
VTELKSRAGRIWGSAAFERIAEGAAASHDALVEVLEPGPANRLLDVATGTGAVALRAAARGASVTAIDVSAELLARAGRAARDAGIALDLRVADARNLPFERGAFDLVASAQGIVFAPDQEAVARELARVCAPGGRLALTCPAPDGFPYRLARLLAAFRFDATEEWFAPFAWGVPSRAEQLLAADFTLRFEQIDAPFRADSAREARDVYFDAFGPLAAVAQALGPACRAELRTRVLELFRRYVTSDGVVAPRPLLLVVGCRR